MAEKIPDDYLDIKRAFDRAWEKSLPLKGEHPAHGSAVAALIVNHAYGGVMVAVDTADGPHYWNVINNEAVDLVGLPEGEHSNARLVQREELMAQKGPARGWHLVFHRIHM